jgi:hypothetical protein
MHIGGYCAHCKRSLRIEMEPLVERFGPETKTRDVMLRITCKECGKRVSVSLFPEKTGP